MKKSEAVSLIAVMSIGLLFTGCIFNSATQTNNLNLTEGGELPEGFTISFDESAQITDSLFTGKSIAEVNPNLNADVDVRDNSADARARVRDVSARARDVTVTPTDTSTRTNITQAEDVPLDQPTADDEPTSPSLSPDPVEE